MILDFSRDKIINLPVSPKERAHQSRSRKGYHVFLSWYFGKYNLLSDKEKHGIFPSSNPTMDDDESLDSASKPPAIHVSTVKK